MATQASLDTAQEFYIAYIGIPADVAGLDYWGLFFEYTDDLTTPISDFGNYVGYVIEYGELDNDTLINSLYQQLFNRDADPGGLAFYVGRLESGEATLASIPKQILDGAIGSDAAILANKVSTAHCITDNYLDSYTFNEEWEVFLDTVGLDPVICEELPYYADDTPLVVTVGVSEGEANSLFDI